MSLCRQHLLPEPCPACVVSKRPGGPFCEHCRRDVYVSEEHDRDCPFYGLTQRDPMPAVNPKDALASRKPALRYIPWGALLPIGRVMQWAAERKYGWMNWRRVKIKRYVYHEAALRHLLAVMDGEDLDPETHEPHEAHIASCMMILLDAQACGTLDDSEKAPAGRFGHFVEAYKQANHADPR